MFQSQIERFKSWQLKCATIRYLDNCDDRQLKDMGIAREAIPALAARTADVHKSERQSQIVLSSQNCAVAVAKRSA